MLPSTPPSRWCAMWYTHVPITMPSGAYPARISVQKSCPDRSEVNGWFLLLRHWATPPPPAPSSALTAVPTAMNSAMSLPNSDDAVRVQFVGLGLHPAHGQLAGVVHRLGQDVELLVPAPPADLQADVVDRAAQHQAERPEAGLADQQELVHRQVGGEDGPGLPRLQLGQAAHRVLRHPAGRVRLHGTGLRALLLVGHCLSLVGTHARRHGPSLTRAAWRRCGSSERMARLGSASCRSLLANRAMAVPMIVTSAIWSLPCCWDGHSRSRTRMPMSLITTPSAPRLRTSLSSWIRASCRALFTSSV